MNENNELEIKKRRKYIFSNIIQISLIGLAYYVLTSIFGIYIPCPFFAVTDKYCPGCGITRMCIAIIELDFEAAMRSNVLLFCMLPIVVIYGIAGARKYIKTGEWFTALWHKICVIITLIIVVSFWIMRNTDKFCYLAPHQ